MSRPGEPPAACLGRRTGPPAGNPRAPRWPHSSVRAEPARHLPWRAPSRGRRAGARAPALNWPRCRARWSPGTTTGPRRPAADKCLSALQPTGPAGRVPATGGVAPAAGVCGSGRARPVSAVWERARAPRPLRPKVIGNFGHFHGSFTFRRVPRFHRPFAASVDVTPLFPVPGNAISNEPGVPLFRQLRVKGLVRCNRRTHRSSQHAEIGQV
jgi:hypothetical protein